MSSLRLSVVSALLVFAAACGGGSSSPPAPTAPSPAPTPAGPSSSITIPVGATTLGNRQFTPPDRTVDVGATVTWLNTDRETHTSTSDATGWNSGSISPGQQFSFTFRSAGTFPYHCSIHPGMVGSVVVR
jgi:plastocyanin